MLPEFRSQVFQLPLIGTTWTYVQNRYEQEKKNALFPIRFMLSIVEQTILLVHENVIHPFVNPYHTYLNKLDHFLCSYIDTIRYYCPIVDQTTDELFDRYGDLLFPSLIHKNSASCPVNSNSNPGTSIRKEKKFKFIERYFQFLTKILMIIEMYSKYVQNELNDHIDTSRNLWKNLNMGDGRSLDEVESFSEKLLVLGRRIIGNYCQFVYLIRYQLKRCRYILFSFLYVEKRFRSTIWRITQKVQMNRMNQNLNHRARYGLVTSKERVRHYLEVMMLHAAKHPWMRWTIPQSNQSSQPQFQGSLKFIRPMFFVSSNNTSDCSGSEDNPRHKCSNMFESTPYRKDHKLTHLIHSKAQIEDVLSNISSSSSSTLEQSFDVKDIIRQVGSQSRQTSDTSDSIDQDEEYRLIEQALNQSNDHEPQQQQQPPPPVSVFDLSPMLASGCAV